MQVVVLLETDDGKQHRIEVVPVDIKDPPYADLSLNNWAHYVVVDEQTQTAALKAARGVAAVMESVAIRFRSVALGK